MCLILYSSLRRRKMEVFLDMPGLCSGRNALRFGIEKKWFAQNYLSFTFCLLPIIPLCLLQQLQMTLPKKLQISFITYNGRFLYNILGKDSTTEHTHHHHAAVHQRTIKPCYYSIWLHATLLPPLARTHAWISAGILIFSLGTLKSV